MWIPSYFLRLYKDFLRITQPQDKHYIKVNNEETNWAVGSEIFILRNSLLKLDIDGLYRYNITYLYENQLRTNDNPRKEHCI